MSYYQGLVVNGIIALALSLALYKITNSYLGWAVLAIPGSLLVIYGTLMIFRGYD
jgi:hypothetical protein